MIDKLLAVFAMWLVGAPIYLPGVLNLLGIYKGWYLAPFIPPFSWRRSIHAWPASAVFVCFPITLLPLSDDAVMKILASVGVAGVVFAITLMIWNPRWAKPAWQRRLEDRYSRDEIDLLFMPAWRKMNRKEWGRLIETEEGLEQLVQMARSS
jgi:hypothetical protein